MSNSTPPPVAGWSDVPALDLTCDYCGETGRMHPCEAYIEQVRMWLTQHRHHERLTEV